MEPSWWYKLNPYNEDVEELLKRARGDGLPFKPAIWLGREVPELRSENCGSDEPPGWWTLVDGVGWTYFDYEGNMHIQMGFMFWSGVWRHHQHLKKNKMPLEMDMASDPWNQFLRGDGERSTPKPISPKPRCQPLFDAQGAAQMTPT